MIFRLLHRVAYVAGWIHLLAYVCAAAETIDFNRHIRPILSDRCYECHGPDQNQRQAGLRLDMRESALQEADSGSAAIVPSDPDASELVSRIFSSDENDVMPPADANKQLSAAEKELLKQWIAEGAVYQQHWSLTAIRRPEVPDVKRDDWPRNEIDRFILSRLEQEELQPSPEADWTTLLRRLALDLTGLPPTPENAVRFVEEMRDAEKTSTADRVLDQWLNRLLDSPHYGERMAVDWLDAARFADSNGYQVDRDREMYAWRDWVIEAFNTNKPFDDFTIEQLAGDLLPNPTLSQKIATGFHRNHLMNEEGGIIPEEFLAEYCADRVETTATVWLGLTFNCCRCHDHKYDPFSQTDFYSLYAFFHNNAEKGVGNYGANIRRNAPPVLKLPAPEVEAKLASLQKELTRLKQELSASKERLKSEQPAWEERLRSTQVAWTPLEFASMSVEDADISMDVPQTAIDVPVIKRGKHDLAFEVQLPEFDTTALRIECVHPEQTSSATGDHPREVGFGIKTIQVSSVGEDSGDSEVLKAWPAEQGNSLPTSDVAKTVDQSERTAAHISLRLDTHVSLALALDKSVPRSDQARLRFAITLASGTDIPTWRLRVQATPTDAEMLAPTDILELVQRETGERSNEDVARLASFYTENTFERRRLNDRVTQLDKQIDETDLQIPTTLVMQELPEPRPTFILVRGAYDKPGDPVTANTPSALPAMSPELPRNRLGLARWLVDPTNPLTARVAVNRFWQTLFGTGLVRTAEDFGTQGELPYHPELLDWLAAEFVASGWDVKAMMRLLVTSATYQQSSRLRPALYQRDPENRLLARGPRFRLQAEFVRDQALAASGLLVTKLGGPSVRPYHPPGLYEQVVAGSGTQTYVMGKGEELYRRSLYTYWKRSVPNPAMLVFDAPFREMCAVRRSRTNTPLQALNLMNDPTYVEAARFLAQRMIREGGHSPREQLTHGYHLVLARQPSPTELSVLSNAFHREYQGFSDDVQSAEDLLQVGESSADTELDPTTLAAMTTVASTILNLDETLTKE